LNEWSFDRERFRFSAEDLLKFESLKDFDLGKAWESISVRPEMDRQILAKILETTAVRGYEMGVWLFLLILLVGAVTMRKWQTGRLKMHY